MDGDKCLIESEKSTQEEDSFVCHLFPGIVMANKGSVDLPVCHIFPNFSSCFLSLVKGQWGHFPNKV